MQTHTNDRILGCKWSQIDEKKHHTSAWIISNQLVNTIDDGNRPYFLLVLQWSLQNFRWVHGYRTPKLNSNARLRHSTVAHSTCAILADFNTACLLLARVAAKASFCGKFADIDYEMGSNAAIKPVLGHGPCNHWFNDRGCHFLCLALLQRASGSILSKDCSYFLPTWLSSCQLQLSSDTTGACLGLADCWKKNYMLQHHWHLPNTINTYQSQVARHTFAHFTLHSRRVDGIFASKWTSPSLALPHSGPSISSCCGPPCRDIIFWYDHEKVEWNRIQVVRYHDTSSNIMRYHEMPLPCFLSSLHSMQHNLNSSLAHGCPALRASSNGQASFGSA